MSKAKLLGWMWLGALAAMPARAGDLSGLVIGDFAYTRVPQVKPQGLPNIDTDQYTFKAKGLYTFDNPGFGVQIEGQDNFYFGKKFELAHLWSAGGSIFFRDNKGTIGASFSYASVDAPAPPLFSGKTSVQSYGGFGEYYVFKDLTLQAKVGGTTGAVGEASVYGGVGLVWYDSPDFAFHSELNFTSYTSANNWTNVKAWGEYLPFNSIPVSFYMGYDFVNISGLGYTHMSTFLGGLKFHFGEGYTLRDYQRTGPLEWTANSEPGANLKF